MRILQVHNHYRQAGGEDVVVAREAALLRLGGHEVFAFTDANPRGTRDTAAALLRAPWNAGAARRAQAHLRECGAQLAHVHNTWFALSPSVVSALHDAGVPVVMTLHNYRLMCLNALFFREGRPCEDCLGRVPWRGFMHGCVGGSCLRSLPAAATTSLNRAWKTWQRAVSVFIAPSHFVRDKYVQGGLPGERVIVRPHFTDDPGARAIPPSQSEELLYVGRVDASKGVLTAIQAFQQAAIPDLALTIVGDGPDRVALEQETDARVRFTGWLDPAEVRQRMKGARALLFPSLWYETFGLSLIEAMAAGLPVVASRLGAIPEVLGSGTGLLPPPGDSPAWATAMSELRDPETVDALGQTARARWRARYTPERALRSLESIYLAASEGR